MVILINFQNAFTLSTEAFSKIVGIFMEAPNIIMKLSIILFWIFDRLNLDSNFKVDWNPFWVLGKSHLGSKIGVGLTQIWSPNLISCLARICFCQIITIGLLELPGQIGSSNLFVCQVEQIHLVWRFWEGLASPCYCFQLLLVNISKFKRCHDANIDRKSVV